MKIIQDMDDMQRFDLQKYLSEINYVINPNGETLDQLVSYSQLIKNAYLDKTVCLIANYVDVLAGWGISHHLINQIVNQINEFLPDQQAMFKIKSIYDLMLMEFNKQGL